MMTLDMSFADIVSPDTVTILEHPQLAVLPVCADTSFPQDLHLTLIGSIYQRPITYTLLLYITNHPPSLFVVQDKVVLFCDN